MVVTDPVPPAPPEGARPDWLRPPGDPLASRPALWSRTAARDPDGVLRIGGVRVTDLVERYGTPVYVFDEEDFRGRCAEFRSAFAGADIYYAGKAFLCRAVARLVQAEGLALDVCTGGELAVALAAGFPPERILLHGNNKSAQELQLALTCGVGRVVVDSFDEIALLDRLAARAGARPRVLVRVTVGVRPQTHPHIATAHEDQKFGFLLSGGDAARAVRAVRASGHLRLAGLHVHLGSQILDPTYFEVGIERVLGLHAEVADEHGLQLPELNLGGGFGIAYVDGQVAPPAVELADRLGSAVARRCAALGVAVPRLAIEPGRAIAGPAGCTVYRVGTVKPVAGRRTYVAVDGGMGDNIRPALYDAVYSAALAGRQSDRDPMLCRVVGKHCDAGDIVVPDDFLPADLRVGDLLAVPGTGAYCRSLANNFNHVPRPPVVAVAGGRHRPILRRETDADLLRLDVG